MFSKSPQPVTGTILVADDQVSNRELLEELLTAEGFKVATCFRRHSRFGAIVYRSDRSGDP